MNHRMLQNRVNALMNEAIFLLRHRDIVANLPARLEQIQHRFHQLHNDLSMKRNHLVHLYNVQRWQGTREQRYRDRQRFNSKNTAISETDAVLRKAYRNFAIAVRTEFDRNPYDPTQSDKSVGELLNALAEQLEDYAKLVTPGEAVSANHTHSHTQTPGSLTLAELLEASCTLTGDTHALVLTGPSIKAYQQVGPNHGGGVEMASGILTAALILRLISLPLAAWLRKR